MDSEFGHIQFIVRGMLKATLPVAKELRSPKWRPLIIGVGVAVIFGVVVLFWPPQRSTAAYCKIWSEGSKKLQSRDSVSHADEYAAFYAKLERVSPDDIRGDVRVQKLVYQKMATDPTQSLSASLSGISANSNVNEWSQSHCPSGTILNQ
jgi:hypothetical protein